MSPDQTRTLVLATAAAEGFDAVGICAADAPPERLADLRAWLAAGYAGDMTWMAERMEARAHPRTLWPQARSIVLLGVNYAVSGKALAGLAHKDKASIALYALRRDYHDVIKAKLKAVARAVAAQTRAGVKVFVDTAPVMEKPLAQQAGLGWQGKNTVLTSRTFGAWLLLGAVFTENEITPDAPETDHCGSCTKCLAACPTAAFPAPYRLDATRCIAYLTIEHKGVIAADLREKFGNRIFGCDDCLAVCPWNKFAQASRFAKLALREDLVGLPLETLATLDDTAFRALFASTPIKRTGRARFVRNVLIAIGNSGNNAFVPLLEGLLQDPEPLVRGMAIWALGRLAPERIPTLAARFLPAEHDADARAEWQAAL